MTRSIYQQAPTPVRIVPTVTALVVALQLLEQPEPFQSHLRERADEIVGTTMSAASCPIAEFVAENGAQGVCVTRYYLYWNPENFRTVEPTEMPHVDLPRWARQFVPTLDELALTDPDVVDPEPDIDVTGAEALVCLERALATLEEQDRHHLEDKLEILERYDIF